MVTILLPDGVEEFTKVGIMEIPVHPFCAGVEETGIFL